MVNKNVNSSVKPELVEVFPTKQVYMRKNIVEKEDEDGNKYFEYDEVFFISETKKEEIEADFDKYWLIGAEYGLTVSIEQRIDTIEELLEELING